MADRYIPTESAEQQALMQWANAQSAALPALKLLYHVPNEGNRGVIGGVHMQRMGLKKGVPDMCLPVPSGGHHGLYIELKRQKGGTPTEEQVWWMDALTKNGYCVCWARGWHEAANAIIEYIKTGEVTFDPTKGRGGEYHAAGGK